MLALENSIYGFRFSCPTCPFVFNIHKKLSSRWYPKLKQVDEILSDSAMWENVDSTDEKCPKCIYLIIKIQNALKLIKFFPKIGEHPRAYFMQLQTRSADEPMTTFYRCCNNECQNKWKEG